MRPRVLLLVSFLVVIGILGTAGGVYAWQHHQVSDRSAALTVAKQQVQTLTVRGRTLQDQIGTLQGRLDSLTAKERSLAFQLQAVQGRRGELASELRATRAQRDAVNAQLQQAKDQLGATRTQLAALQTSTTTTMGRLFATGGTSDGSSGRSPSPRHRGSP